MPTNLLSTTETVESCWIKLSIKYTKPILLGVIYKPPQTPVGQIIKILTDILSKIQPASTHEGHSTLSVVFHVICR